MLKDAIASKKSGKAFDLIKSQVDKMLEAADYKDRNEEEYRQMMADEQVMMMIAMVMVMVMIAMVMMAMVMMIVLRSSQGW